MEPDPDPIAALRAAIQTLEMTPSEYKIALELTDYLDAVVSTTSGFLDDAFVASRQLVRALQGQGFGPQVTESQCGLRFALPRSPELLTLYAVLERARCPNKLVAMKIRDLLHYVDEALGSASTPNGSQLSADLWRAQTRRRS